MNRLLKKFILYTCMVALLSVRADAQPVNPIELAMKAGDATEISRYFGSSIDITINNTTSTYSRTQGEMVLRDFFSRNAVREYDIEHLGNSTSGQATFTIGYITTSTGRYKVYMWFRPKDNGYLLKELRFEK